jgi:hypothetical protein
MLMIKVGIPFLQHKANAKVRSDGGCIPTEEFDHVQLCSELAELLNDVIHHHAILEPHQAQVLELHG